MRRRPGRRRAAVVVAGGAVVLLVGALLVGLTGSRQAAAWTPDTALARAQPFAVLAGGTVRASGTSSITGDVGGAAVSGLDGQIGGSVRSGDDLAQALADLAAADDTLTDRPPTAKPTTLDGRLGPGTYAFSGDVAVTRSVVLDAGGDPDAVFVVRSASTITTAEGATVTLAGGARACNVFWLATDSATVGGTMVGTVVVRSRITADPRSTLTGRLLSRGGDIRLDSATVRVPTDCGGSTATPGTATAPDTASTPGAAADPTAAPTAPAVAPEPEAGHQGRPAAVVGGTGTGTGQGTGGARASGGGVPHHATTGPSTGRSTDRPGRTTGGHDDPDGRSGTGRDTAAARPVERPTPERGGNTRTTGDARTGGAGTGGPGSGAGSGSGLGSDDADGRADDPPSLGDRLRQTGVGVGFGAP